MCSDLLTRPVFYHRVIIASLSRRIYSYFILDNVANIFSRNNIEWDWFKNKIHSIQVLVVFTFTTCYTIKGNLFVSHSAHSSKQYNTKWFLILDTVT